ncbi:MAG: hypothetical protein JWL84_4205 [Rhodospirillales bacterium]|jgi:hypothetical protein|nr:hypothetical protein [Rhodospirillales bacterium]
MTNLSETQLIILHLACQRSGGLVLPLPGHLKGGAAKKVIGALAAKGLIEEIEAQAGHPVWRQTGDDRGVTLVATDAAFQALGIETAEAARTSPARPRKRRAGPTHRTSPKAAPAASAGASPRKPRAASKQAQLIAMLKRAKGASIEEMVAAFGWQAHTVRGAIAGALKKKLGLNVTSEKVDGRGRIYRIA